MGPGTLQDCTYGSNEHKEVVNKSTELQAAFAKDELARLRAVEDLLSDKLPWHSIGHEHGQALPALSADVQADIIKSDISNCRNPSAVLLSRINQSRAGAQAKEFVAWLGLNEKVFGPSPPQLVASEWAAARRLPYLQESFGLTHTADAQNIFCRQRPQ